MLGADGKAIQAVIAALPAQGADAHQGDPTQQAIKGTHRAEMAAPGPPADEEVEQEDGNQDAPG
jgi:hypothetical protein